MWKDDRGSTVESLEIGGVLDDILSPSCDNYTLLCWEEHKSDFDNEDYSREVFLLEFIKLGIYGVLKMYYAFQHLFFHIDFWKKPRQTLSLQNQWRCQTPQRFGWILRTDKCGYFFIDNIFQCPLSYDQLLNQNFLLSVKEGFEELRTKHGTREVTDLRNGGYFWAFDWNEILGKCYNFF